MKRDAIERLAIDSAAGELNEDVEALFREYLSEHPEASPGSEEMARIYEETAAAIEAKTRRADPGEPLVKTRRFVHPNWRAFGRWAAALIVAAIIGFAGGRWPITGKTSRTVFATSTRPVVQVKTVSDLKEQYAGTFWGDKVLALMEQRAAKQHEVEFRDVGFWQKYRKETGYE